MNVVRAPTSKAWATEGLVVLVVESDEQLRQELGERLESEGLVVLFCPGPSSPDYSCVGIREGACPLAQGADIVVVDAALDSDLVMTGASAFDLLSYYRSLEKPIVLLADAEDRLRLLSEPGVEVLMRPVPHEALGAAMRRALAANGHSGQGGDFAKSG
jgi:CheY-like chemotaxis protein